MFVVFDLLLNKRNSEDSVATGELLMWGLMRDRCENLMTVLYYYMKPLLFHFFQVTEIQDLDKKSPG